MHQCFKPNTKTDLVFSRDYDTTSANLLRAPSAFMSALQHTDELVVEAGQDDDVIICTPGESFKMKGIGLSKTLLVVDREGIIHHQSTGFLEVQHFDPPYSQICNALRGMANEQIGLAKNCTAQDLMVKYSWPKSFLMSQFRLNAEQYGILARAMKILYDESVGHCLYLPNHILAELMREIITYLTSNNLSLEAVSAHRLANGVPAARGLIMQYIAQFFNLGVQEGKEDCIYMIGADAVCHYVVLEMAIAKQEYTKSQFHEIAEEMLAIYLPAHYQKPSLQTVLYLHFIENKQTYKVYDYMAIDPELLNRLKFLNSIKRRWKSEELVAVLRGIPSREQGKEMEVSELLAKKFRKYGEEYEIRIVLPK